MMMLSLLLACSALDQIAPAGVEDPPAVEPEAPAAPSEVLQIFFAGNFDGTGTCRKGELTGCDLFSLEYDLATGAVSSITPLATTRDVGEDFPVVDPAGRFVIHQRANDQTPLHDLRYIMLESGKTGEVARNAREPALSHDGTTLGYTVGKGRQKFGVVLKELQVKDGALHAGAPVDLSTHPGSTEPIFLPGDQQVAIYRKGREPMTGQTLIIDRASGSETAFSPPVGCAHGAVSPSGSRMFCQSGNFLYVRTFADGQWSEQEKRPVPRVSDPAFTGCDQITFGHPEICASDDLILATYSCQKGPKKLTSAQLALLTWEGEVVSLLSREVAAQLGHKGEARSGVCRKK